MEATDQWQPLAEWAEGPGSPPGQTQIPAIPPDAQLPHPIMQPTAAPMTLPPLSNPDLTASIGAVVVAAVASKMVAAMAMLEQTIDSCMAAFKPPLTESVQSTSAGQSVATLSDCPQSAGQFQQASDHSTPQMQAQASELEEDMGQDSKASEAEDSELSEEEPIQQDPPGIRLFYPDQFPKHLLYAHRAGLGRGFSPSYS